MEERRNQVKRRKDRGEGRRGKVTSGKERGGVKSKEEGH